MEAAVAAAATAVVASTVAVVSSPVAGVVLTGRCVVLTAAVAAARRKSTPVALAPSFAPPLGSAEKTASAEFPYDATSVSYAAGRKEDSDGVTCAVATAVQVEARYCFRCELGFSAQC